MPVHQLFLPLFPAAVHCGTLQGARDKNFLVLLVVHSVELRDRGESRIFRWGFLPSARESRQKNFIFKKTYFGFDHR